MLRSSLTWTDYRKVFCILRHGPQLIWGPVYGGRDPFVFDPLDNPVLQYYQRTAASSETVTAPTRAPSFASAADVFYTAHNTPLNSPESSRRPSTYATMGLGEGLLKMTASSAPEDDTYQSASLTDQSPSEEGPMTSASSSRQTSKASSSSQWSSLTAMQRIKSLTNFHLYLSPSRLAQVDLLSDSSGDEPTPRPIAFPPRRSVRPAFLEPHAASVADRRSRPPLRVHGIPSHLASDQQVRSYSDQLQQHHAKRLEGLDGRAMVLPDNPVRAPEATEQNLDPELESQSSSATTSPEESRPISAFSRSSNPWFGYPALIVSDTSHPGTIHIRPRYPRNRKRDLVKTLLFLFMIRLQSWRDTFERMLGLYRLPSWGLRTVARTPSEGLILSAGKSISRKRGPLAVTRSRDTEKGWIWMVIGFLLLRGTWTRVIAGPLEALGLESVRDLLGLV